VAQNAFVQDWLTAWAKANLPDGDPRIDSAVAALITKYPYAG